MSPYAHLGPGTGLFIFSLVGVTSGEMHGNGGPSWPRGRMSWEVGWSQALTKVLMAALVGLRSLCHPGEGEGLANPHVDVTGFLPSLSLPPSHSACFSLLFLSLSHPLRIPSLTHPTSVACGSWGHPILLPSLLAWPCLLSRCLPQEVGTRLSLLPATIQGRRLVAQTPGPWADRLRKCRASPHWGWTWDPNTPVPACLSSHALLCPRPGGQPHLPCACSASHSPPRPPRGPVPVLSPGPLPPLPFQGAG